jgi:hypothetical protein
MLQHNSQGRRDSDKLEAPDIKKPQGSLSHKLGLFFFLKKYRFANYFNNIFVNQPKKFGI